MKDGSSLTQAEQHSPMNLWQARNKSPNADQTSGKRGIGIALVLSLVIHVSLFRVIASDTHENVRAHRSSPTLITSFVRAEGDSSGISAPGGAHADTRTLFSTSVGTQHPSELAPESEGGTESLPGGFSVPARPEIPIDLRDIPAPKGSGQVSFTILVDENGIVRGADSDNKLAPAWFVDAILDRLRASRFVPAFSNGWNVTSVVKGVVEYQGEDGTSTTNDNDR